MSVPIKKRCHACQKFLDVKIPVGRQELCPFCGSDLHCCRNCAFYAKGAYNECREPQAERVLEKGRSNFCDFFAFREGSPDLKETADKASARMKLESLFKKG